MTKVVVETTGDFHLLDVSTGTLYRANRLTLAVRNSFLQQQVARDRAAIVCAVNDELTADELREYEKEAEDDRELLIESLTSAYPVDGVSEPEKPKARRGGRKPKAAADKEPPAAPDADKADEGEGEGEGQS